MMKKVLMTLALVSLLGGGSCLMGCAILPTGGSEAGFGAITDTRVFMYHKTNMELEGVEAKFAVDVDPLADLIIKLREDAEPVDETPGS